jgi:Trm5-related predicted tRNA methylase
MKKMQSSEPNHIEKEELLPEYDFDYSKARPNRFADLVDADRVVILDPDVAAVFTTSEAVNAVLRALITTMPEIAR